MSVVPNLFGTRDQFHGRQFFHGCGGWAGGKGGDGLVQVVMRAMVQAVMQAIGSGR